MSCEGTQRSTDISCDGARRSTDRSCDGEGRSINRSCEGARRSTDRSSSLSWSEGDVGGFDGRDNMVKISILGRWPGGRGEGEPYRETNR